MNALPPPLALLGASLGGADTARPAVGRTLAGPGSRGTATGRRSSGVGAVSPRLDGGGPSLDLILADAVRSYGSASSRP
jgi:hypothetical protein